MKPLDGYLNANFCSINQKPDHLKESTHQKVALNAAFMPTSTNKGSAYASPGKVNIEVDKNDTKMTSKRKTNVAIG